jgi:hypothetical protein
MILANLRYMFAMMHHVWRMQIRVYRARSTSEYQDHSHNMQIFAERWWSIAPRPEDYGILGGPTIREKEKAVFFSVARRTDQI